MKTTELQTAFKRLVNKLCREYFEDGLDMDDLHQEAWLAIFEHAPLYKEEMGLALKQFLGRRVRDSLRTYKAKALNRQEIERYWEAESISGGPDHSIQAKTKEECEFLRQKEGAGKFAKPKRVEVVVSMTSSLDDDLSFGDEGGDSPYTLHDTLGVPADQEQKLHSARVARIIDALSSKEREVLLGRAENKSIREIASSWGVDKVVVQRVLERAQKKLKKVREVA